MSDYKNIQDKIDDYIRGTMSAQERVIFESELQTDPELMKEFHIQSTIVNAIQSVSLKRYLQDVESAYRKKNKAVRAFIRFMATVAAALVLLFTTGGILRNHHCRQAGRFYYSELAPVAARSANSIDSLLSLAFDQLGQKRYVEADSSLQEATAIAETILNEPIVDEESKYEHLLIREKKCELDWYSAISLMLQGKVHKAKKVLSQIAETDSPYATEASKLLKSKFTIKS